MAHSIGIMKSSLAFLLVCAPFATASADGDPLIDCARRNAPTKSSRQSVEFRSVDRMGNGRTIAATVSWERVGERSRVLLRVHEPADLDGAGLLLLEQADRTDMFIYLPDLKKVKRVTSHMLSGSLFGSDFTYEDFMQFQGISVEGRREELEKTMLDGVEVRVLAQYPSDAAGSAYERIVSYWDSETCVPLKTEMFETGDKLRKVLTIDRDALFRAEGAIIPQEAKMNDLRDETSTQLTIKNIEINVKIPRKFFSKSGLEQPRVF